MVARHLAASSSAGSRARSSKREYAALSRKEIGVRSVTDSKAGALSATTGSGFPETGAAVRPAPAASENNSRQQTEPPNMTPASMNSRGSSDPRKNEPGRSTSVHSASPGFSSSKLSFMSFLARAKEFEKALITLMSSEYFRCGSTLSRV